MLELQACIDSVSMIFHGELLAKRAASILASRMQPPPVEIPGD
jgi:hypothetical protein